MLPAPLSTGQGFPDFLPDQLDATFAALADPTRRAILTRLAAGEASVMELTEPFAMTQPADATQRLERYRRFWEGSFERLDTLLDELKKEGKKRGRNRR